MTLMQRAYAEEILSALFLCAGFLADAGGYGWLAWACWIKAGWDTVCAVTMWYQHAQVQKTLEALR